MKYEILTEGGFIGISKKYEGELELSADDLTVLLLIMNESRQYDTDLRDGIVYHVTLFDNEKSIEAKFDEKNLPRVIRSLISN